jgi:hypothetical protein
MSHHFKAKGGTSFNFNSDLSGDVNIAVPADYGTFAPGADLLEFVDWYRRTPGYGAPDPEDGPEALTEEERRELEVYVSVTGPESIRGVEDEVAKLLRIHDRLQGEMKRAPSPETTAALLMRESHAIDRYRTIVLAWAEQVRDLAPRIGLRVLEGLPDDVRAVLEGPSPKAAYVAPSLETFDLGPDLTPTRSPR